MPVNKWVLFRVKIEFLKQTYSVCPATYNVLYNCAASEEMYHTDCVDDHFDLLIPNTGLV